MIKLAKHLHKAQIERKEVSIWLLSIIYTYVVMFPSFDSVFCSWPTLTVYKWQLTDAHAKAIREIKRSVGNKDDDSIISEVESESETIEDVEFEAYGSLEESLEDDVEGGKRKWQHASILPFVGWMPPVFWMFRSDLKHSCGPFVYTRQLASRWLWMNESITPNEYRPFTRQNDQTFGSNRSTGMAL